MSIEPPPDFYVRYCTRLALLGRDPSLPIEPETEPSNVHSIEAGRTRRTTREMLRRRGEL
jgi:hypothetical protein